MVIFNSYVSLQEGNPSGELWGLNIWGFIQWNGDFSG